MDQQDPTEAKEIEKSSEVESKKRTIDEVELSFDLLTKVTFVNSGTAKPGMEIEPDDEVIHETKASDLTAFKEAIRIMDINKSTNVVAAAITKIVGAHSHVMKYADYMDAMFAFKGKFVISLVDVMTSMKQPKLHLAYVYNMLLAYNILIASPNLKKAHNKYVFHNKIFKAIIEWFDNNGNDITNQCMSITDNICRDMGANRDAMVNLGVIGGLTEVLKRCRPKMVPITNVGLALSHATSSPQTIAGDVRKAELLILIPHLSKLFTTDLPEGLDCEGNKRDDNEMCKACVCEIMCQMTSRECRQDIIDALFARDIPQQILEAVRSGGLGEDGTHFAMGALSNILLSNNSTHIDTLIALDGFFDALEAAVKKKSDVTEHGAIHVLRNLLVDTSEEVFNLVIESKVLSAAQDKYKDKVTDDDIHICFAAAFRSAMPEQLFALLNNGCFLMLFGVLASHDLDEGIVSLVLSCLVCVFEKLDKESHTLALQVIQPPEWRDEVQYWKKHGQDHEVQELAEKLLELVLVEL